MQDYSTGMARMTGRRHTRGETVDDCRLGLACALRQGHHEIAGILRLTRDIYSSLHAFHGKMFEYQAMDGVGGAAFILTRQAIVHIPRDSRRDR